MSAIINMGRCETLELTNLMKVECGNGNFAKDLSINGYPVGCLFEF